jgi:hypothetical protein
MDANLQLSRESAAEALGVCRTLARQTPEYFIKSVGASVLAVVNQLLETVLPEKQFSPHVAHASTCASIA